MVSYSDLIFSMIDYYKGDPKRIQHFIKVHAFAKLIGEGEHLSDREMEILQIAALTHDIGIKNSELKYGNAGGKNQEKEGPPEADALLRSLGYTQEQITRVCFLIGHHHTYDKIDSIDYQILVEADFLVNFFEEDLPTASIVSALAKIFKTSTGKTLCRTMFGLE